jgi:hypothetical protein
MDMKLAFQSSPWLPGSATPEYATGCPEAGGTLGMVWPGEGCSGRSAVDIFGIDPTVIYAGVGVWYMRPWWSWWQLDDGGWWNWRGYETTLAAYLEAAGKIAPQLAISTTHDFCDERARNYFREAMLEGDAYIRKCADDLVGSSSVQESWQTLYEACADARSSHNGSRVRSERVRKAVASLPASTRYKVAIVDAFGLTDGRCEMLTGSDVLHHDGLMYDEAIELLVQLGWAERPAPSEIRSPNDGSCILDASLWDPEPTLWNLAAEAEAIWNLWVAESTELWGYPRMTETGPTPL